MATLNVNDLIQRYNKKQSILLNPESEKNYATGRLLENKKEFSYSKTYDIFLSHSFNDARIVKIIKEMLEEKGYSIYVDWIEDNHLGREKVSTTTAYILRMRMNNCLSLIYLTSQSAEKSVWMPWELGYMDAKNSKVAVAPILEDDEDFDGREYLGLYPYLDLTNNDFYIHSAKDKWVNFKGWMDGEQPEIYQN